MGLSIRTASLNPDANVFVPRNAPSTSEDFMTADQASEIEACQSFVELCAYLESMEEAHLVETFLRSADAEKIAEVQKRVAENLRLCGTAVATAGTMERAVTQKAGTA